jgi:hypothetical protein
MPQPKQPTGVIDIIAASWKNLTINLKLYLEFTAWSVVIGLALWILIFLINQVITDRLVARTMITIVSIPFSLAFMTITLALIYATWKCLSNKKPTLKESISVGIKLLIPFIWLSILTGLIFLIIPASVFGLGFSIAAAAKVYIAQYFWLYIITVALLAALGGAMIMIPIYYMLPIYFSANYLTIDGLRGWTCLKRCAQLVRGRWWKTFWRLVVPGVFFWLAVQFSIKIVYLLFGSVLGDPGMFFSVGASNNGGTLFLGIVVLIVAEIIYGIAAPLFAGANLIVWSDLKRFEGKE